MKCAHEPCNEECPPGKLYHTITCRNRAYRERNAEHIRELKAAYRLRNLDRIREYEIEYTIRRTAKRRAETGRANMTKRDWEEMVPNKAVTKTDYISNIRSCCDPLTHRYNGPAHPPVKTHEQVRREKQIAEEAQIEMAI